jgi:hypothetical protein
VSDLESVVDAWLTVPDLAERLGTDATEVRQMIEDRRLLAVRRGDPRVVSVPEAFVVDVPGAAPEVLAWLQGTVNVLADSGFDDESAIRWLFTPDDSFPGGSPIAALLSGHKTEVRRRAQALAL